MLFQGFILSVTACVTVLNVFGRYMMDDEYYMRLALEQAQRGCGQVNPNPLVGCVIVKNNKVIGAGAHLCYGGPHAERNALAACSESPDGAVLYVTLEPCCHWGKTPPCTDALIEARISRVVFGSADPNPLVSGKSRAILESHGIAVCGGVLKSDCDALNRSFFHYITTNTPYCILKYAMTLDGKTATVSGASRWITGEQARSRVHHDRLRYAAVMVGIGTVLADDPMLTCRLDGIPAAAQPLRIVCDTHLQLPLSSQLVSSASVYPTAIATCVSDENLLLPYQKAGCRILSVPLKDGKCELTALMRLLGNMQIDSVIIEGGGCLAWSALKAHIVQRIQAYIAPKIFGGKAPSPVCGSGVLLPSDAFICSSPSVEMLGDDILLECEVPSCLPE